MATKFAWRVESNFEFSRSCCIGHFLYFCGLILVVFLACLPLKSFLCKCHHPKSHHVQVCCHYVLQTSGGSPYPGINGYEIARKLKQGYRMPKPQHVDYNLWVSVTRDVTVITTVIQFNPDEWMKWLYAWILIRHSINNELLSKRGVPIKTCILFNNKSCKGLRLRLQYKIE